MPQTKKKRKEARDVKIGDKIEVGGKICVVIKMESIFHYVPDTDIRFVLSTNNSTSKHDRVILFLPRMMEIEILE